MNKVLLIAYKNSIIIKNYISRVTADGGIVESARCLRNKIFNELK